jgi:hypothetical protein
MGLQATLTVPACQGLARNFTPSILPSGVRCGACVFCLDQTSFGSGSNQWTCNLASDLKAGPIKIGCVTTGDKVYRYPNGVLWCAEDHEWTSDKPPQYRFDLAHGDLTAWEALDLQIRQHFSNSATRSPYIPVAEW